MAEQPPDDIASPEEVLVALVEAALARIAEGTYGQCTVCHRAIVAERLEVVPWAATCVACA